MRPPFHAQLDGESSKISKKEENHSCIRFCQANQAIWITDQNSNLFTKKVSYLKIEMEIIKIVY